MGAGADPSWRAHRVPGNVGSPRWPDRHRGPARGAVCARSWQGRTPRIPNQMAPRWRDDADQATQERDRFEHQVSATVGPWALELV